MNEQDTKIRRFITGHFLSKNSNISLHTTDSFIVTHPDNSSQEYTYQPGVSRERKIPLISTGSPTFQQILRESIENGVLSQILLKPKDQWDSVVKNVFKELPFNCQTCKLVTLGDEEFRLCLKTKPCYHQIINAKISSIKIDKTDPVKYFLFCFSVTFRNKLRPKSEEIITVLLDEKGNCPSIDFELDNLLKDETVEIQNLKGKLSVDVYTQLKQDADQKVAAILREKVAIFDLPLSKEKSHKLKSFQKRFRRERKEQVISKKHDFDFQKWQSNYEILLRREEEAYITNISVKFFNLLVINTAKIKFEIILDNQATINSAFILGIDCRADVTCPICKKTFYEGYATQDGKYVCEGCIRQSIDTGKIYSKKASLTLDEKLKDYIEAEEGFVCSVCGKKYSRLLEFKCSHDNSSICISHYDLC
ncbi:MAG: hypothetical protein ACM3UL_05275, partial [Ignavibacteria bacterium]